MMPSHPATCPARYLFCGATVISDTPLPDLDRVTAAEPAADSGIVVRQGEREAGRLSPLSWFLSFTLSTGEPWLACGKGEDGYLLRFFELADFFVSRDGRTIDYALKPSTTSGTFCHLLLDQVLPLVLNLQGREALHATAVQTPYGVCAFTGPAGAGKSTVAASFLLEGYPVLSDDCLVLEEADGTILATPAYPGLRLWDDTLEALTNRAGTSVGVAQYTSKQRFVGGLLHERFPTAPAPLSRIYSLERAAGPADEGRSPTVEPLSCQESFMDLIASAFRLDVTDRTMLARQFAFLERVVSRVPVRRLRIPNSFAALPGIRKAVLQDLETHDHAVVEP
jgi:hypothetical protein